MLVHQPLAAAIPVVLQRHLTQTSMYNPTASFNAILTLDVHAL